MNKLVKRLKQILFASLLTSLSAQASLPAQTSTTHHLMSTRMMSAKTFVDQKAESFKYFGISQSLSENVAPRLVAFNDFFANDAGISAPESVAAPVAIRAANFKPTPGSSYQFDENQILDIKNLGRFMKDVRVAPALASVYPQGIHIRYNHADFKEFRKEYQFSFESGAPKGMDNNLETGFASVKEEGHEGYLWRLKTKDNSIRMTSPAFRFKPVDFKNFSLKLKVLKGIKGADAAKGGDGDDDSVFQVWFSLRRLKSETDRTAFDSSEDIKIFGYYWGDTNQKGKTPEPGALIESSNSNKSYVFFSMPESYQVFLNGGPSEEQKWHEFRRNFADDLKRAYPKVNPEEWEVVALTVQSDSNSTGTEGEALFEQMAFEP